MATTTTVNNSSFFTPQQQLWKMTDESEHLLITPTLRVLKRHYQEDVCLATIAWIRFGIYREFQNVLLQKAFDTILDQLADANINNACINALTPSYNYEKD